MENQKQKKSAGTVVLVVLLLIVTIAALILATYAWARYTTVETGTATAQVAKWDVTFTEGNNIFSKTYTHVVNDRLAPGTAGSVTMNITSSATETDYDYKIAMTQLLNKPTNLHFYAAYDQSTNAYSKEITFQNVSGSRDADIASNIYGHVALDKTTEGGKAAKNQNITIYWKWEYQTTGIEALPADVDTAYTGVTETKRQRIVHDLNVLLQRKGVIADANGEGALGYDATANENAGGVVVTNSIDLTAMKAIAKSYTVNGATITVSADEVTRAINDAIDTIDGMAALTMQFDIELTAIQCDPTTGATEFTQYLTDKTHVTSGTPSTDSGMTGAGDGTRRDGSKY